MFVAASLALASFGCKGDQGAQGQTGPPGPPGEGFSQYTYQGNFGEPCNHCHATNVNSVLETHHTMAYDDLGDSQSNLYCLQCHTTGFDSYVAYGDTAISDENRGPDENGYDDYVGVDTEEAAERRLALEAVQCESCHGPMGPEFNAHVPDISFSTYTDTLTGESESLCYKCHTTQINEWVTSSHAQSAGGDPEALTEEWGRSSCDYCHTSEGFIRTNDPAYATYEFGDTYHQIGCPTCHDPHRGEAGGGNYAQLRNVGAEEVQYTYPWEPGDDEVPRMEGYGPAQTCAQCHHGRRDTDNVLGQIADGYGHFGPHRSPQMDMFIGAGSYEIPGKTYDRDHAHQTNDTGCVNCHMTRETELHGEIQEHAFHTWEPTVDNCLPCHQGIPDFNVNFAQDTIQAKLDSLAVLFGYTDFLDMEGNWDSEAVGVTVWQREAAYAAFFVFDDGSLGLHNPHYANSLLDNAIAYADSAFASLP
ncbi:MAG: hypothetical protein AMS18_13940 [Gemmatimonas sp. SG8_17]|nr:MAG: hypothetical protein AMS18_13940 [Gemmatimonas sp. SG8_17]